MNQGYAKKIADLMRTTGNRLSLGIDPPNSADCLEAIPFFANEWRRDPISFINAFCGAAIEAAQGRVASVKFQSAFFETAGPEGFAILKSRMAQASAAGLSVILDVKRGDISTSMAAYGKAAFDQLGADAMTINTYMGADVLEAILPWLQKGRGAYLIWMTSNPSAHAVQSAKLASGKTVADMIFHQADAFGRQNDVSSALGFVLGTTRFSDLSAQQATDLRDYTVLLPGIGPQGGLVTPLVKTFMDSCPGAVVPMSRGLTGIGDDQQTKDLSTVESWDDYRAYVSERISAAAALLPC